MCSSVLDSDQIEIIDFGGHYYPQSVLPESKALFGEYVGKKHTDLDELVQWYDKAGVDGAILSQPYYMGHDSLGETTRANDALLKELEDFPEFHGLAAVPTAAGGEAAATEFERCLDKGYIGGAVETKSAGIELNDPAVEPILEVADQRGAPLLVHPKLNDSLHPDVLDDTYRLNSVFGREVALSESIFKVIHDGIVCRFPDVPLVYHHLGGNIAGMLGRIHLELDPGRWPGQDNVLSYETFKSRFEQHIYLDTSGFFGYSTPVRVALEAIPASNILFATDAPYEPRSPAELRRFVSSIGEATPRETARQLLSENTAELIDA